MPRLLRSYDLVKRHMGRILASELGLSDAIGGLVAVLYRGAPEAWVPSFELETCINAETMTHPNTIKVYVNRARAVLGEAAIETMPREGYRLSATVRARIAAILGDN